MTCKDIDYVKRYRDRAREMRALSEIMTHPKTKATMLRLARGGGYDDKADRVLERAAHEVTSRPSPFPKTRNPITRLSQQLRRLRHVS